MYNSGSHTSLLDFGDARWYSLKSLLWHHSAIHWCSIWRFINRISQRKSVLSEDADDDLKSCFDIALIVSGSAWVDASQASSWILEWHLMIHRGQPSGVHHSPDGMNGDATQLVSYRTWLFPTFASAPDASASQSVMPSRLIILVDVFPRALFRFNVHLIHHQPDNKLEDLSSVDVACWYIPKSLLGPRTLLALQHLTHQRTTVCQSDGRYDASETSFIDANAYRGYRRWCACYIINIIIMRSRSVRFPPDERQRTSYQWHPPMEQRETHWIVMESKSIVISYIWNKAMHREERLHKQLSKWMSSW